MTSTSGRRAEHCEAESERLEMLLADLEDSLRDQEACMARLQQEIKTEDTTLVHEAALTADLETELDRTRRRLVELTTRLSTLAQAAGRAESDLVLAETQATSQRREVTALEGDLEATGSAAARAQPAGRRRQDRAPGADAPRRPSAKRSGRLQGPRR